MKEDIITVLRKYGICTTKQLSFLINRDCGKFYKPTEISGTLRVMYTKGEVGHSNCGAGQLHYWLAKGV